MAVLRHCLRKEDEVAKTGLYDILDTLFMRQNFLPLMVIPRHMLMTTLEGHTGAVRCLEYHEGKLYSGSEDGTIRVWNGRDGSLITTLEAHGDIARGLTIHDDKLHSVSDDLTIKVWNCSTHALTATLEGFYGIGDSLTFYDGKMYSGGDMDANGHVGINVYNCSDYSLIATLTHEDDDDENENKGHTDAVIFLTVDDDGKLYSGSDDHTINVWNLSTNQLIKTLRGHTADVWCLTAHDGKLYSGSKDKTIKIWNCSDYKLIKTLTEHTNTVFHLKIHGGKLYSGSWDSTIKVWNCSDHELVATLEGHTKGVYRLKIHDDKLYSGSLIAPSTCGIVVMKPSLLLLEDILVLYMMSPSAMGSCTLLVRIIPSRCGNCKQHLYMRRRRDGISVSYES